MPFRTINNTLRDSLLEGDEFVYAHLIKFEHGKLSTTPEGAQSKTHFAYITDGSHDIEFDDGSVDALGNANGIQTYIANRVKKVGDVTQKIAPTASTVNIQLSSLALNTNITQDITVDLIGSTGSQTIDGFNHFGTAKITGTEDLVEVGFSEGDKIRLLMSNGSDAGNNVAGNNNNLYARINSFSNDNKTAHVTAIAKNLQTVTTAHVATLDFASEEAIGPLRNRNVTGYASYLNRSVLIYKAHINPDTGKVIGMVDGTKKDGVYLLYKGIIATAKLSEDATKDSRISWGLVSHWGDFERVQNRITSDSEHRKTDAAGKSDIESLTRPEYAKDLGFQHSEQAINLLTQYTTMESEPRTGKKKKWYGKKVYIYYVDVEKTNEVDLKFNLQAKTLPVIYGVNKTKGMPVFVDTHKTDASRVYIAYALCEGQVAGLYDIHFDDSSTICVDKVDADNRDTQTENQNIEVLCQGRQDRGDTLGSDIVIDTTSYKTKQVSNTWGGENGSWRTEGWTQQDVPAQGQTNKDPKTTWINQTHSSTTTTNTGIGVKANTGNVFDQPIDSQFIFHDGSPNQKANVVFSTIAKNNDFKIQSDYFDSTSDYWGPNHRLLDTAYLTAEYIISEGETSIPQQHFTVRGKLIDSHNYDGMYRRDIRTASNFGSYSHDINNFNIGDEVTLHVTSTNAEISGGPFTIKDIRQVPEPTPILTETTITKIKFTTVPSLGTTPAFYAKNSSNQKFYLQVHDGVLASGTVGAELVSTITAVTDGSSTGVKITVNPNSPTGIGADYREATLISFNPFNSGYTAAELATIEKLVATIKAGTYTYDTNDSSGNPLANGLLDNIGETTSDKSELLNTQVMIRDAVRLDSNASSYTDEYKGAFIELSVTTAAQTKTYRRQILSYNGARKTAYLDSELPLHATTAFTYKIITGADQRVSINPAMQLLDYLQSDRFGPEMTLEDDLDLDSFLQAARDCDEGSDVVVSFKGNVSSSVFTVGDKYRYPPTGAVQFIGEVKSKTSFTSSFLGISTTRAQVVFTNVIGKLGNKWSNWKTFKAGDLVWYQSKYNAISSGTSGFSSIFTVNAAGPTNIVEATPSATNGQQLTLTNLAQQTGINLRKVGTTTDRAVDVQITNFEGNPLVKSFNENTQLYDKSGYTLYDSDDVKYWRYIGWDKQDQSYVTRHQLSPVIDTSRTLLENTNDFLQQFNGMLRYNNGKYELAIMKESVSTDYESVTVNGVSYTPHIITEDDIVGAINVDDAGHKGMFNTMSATLSDPVTLYNERQVTFFDSNYLKQDKYVPKKGTASTPYITNYYNARMFAKLNLDLSRFSISVNFTMGPKGTLLLPGHTIKLTHARFGWTEKEFRVTSVVLTSDCLVRVSADEHDNNSYANVNNLTVGAITTGEVSGHSPLKSPDAPTNLQVGAARRGGVLLTWDNVSTFDPTTYTVQIWRNSNISYTGASGAELVGTSKGTNFTDQATEEGRTERYYWIRYEVLVPPKRGRLTAAKELFSNYNPVKTANGLLGIADGAVDGSIINLTNSDCTIPTDSSDALVFSNTGTTISVNIGATAVPYDDSSAFASPSFRVTNVATSGITLASPSVNSTSGNNYVTHNIAGISGSTGTITYTIVVKDTIDREVTYNRVQTFSKSLRGSTGATGVNSRTVTLRAGTLAFVYDENGANPSPSSTTLTASSLNTAGTAKYQFMKTHPPTSTPLQAINAQATFTYNAPTLFANTPETIEVRLFEGSDTTTIYASDSISIGAIKKSSSALSAIMSNESHAVPASFAGVVSSMVGTGTTIAVFEGATALEFITSGTVAAGQFEVSANAVSNTITTVGTITGTGTTIATIGDHSGFDTSSDTAKIVYTLSGKRADGTDFSFTREQSFSKSSNAQSIITAELSNPIAQVPTLISSGTTYAAPDMTTSDTDIHVKEGETELTFITSGTTAPGEYKIVTTTNPSTGLTVGGLSRVQSGSIHFARTTDHSAMNVDSIDVIYTITGRRADGEVFVRAPAQSLTKNKIGATGGVGPTSPRVRSGYIYYQSASATNPAGSSAVSNTSVTYNFATDTLSGGVIGTGATNWNQIQPTYTGNNTNKYWYARYTVTEESFGGSFTVTFTVAYEGQNFTGLVTFTANAITDGSSSNSISTTKTNNITTIDGGSITANSITSDEIKLSGSGRLVISEIDNDSGYQVNTSTRTGGSVGGWTLSSTELVGGAGVAIRSGLADYSPTDGNLSGFYLGNENNSFTGNADKPVFMVGTEQQERLTWNGTTLEIVGNLTVGKLGSGWGINQYGIYAPADEANAIPQSGGDNNTKYTSLVNSKNVIQLLYDTTTGGSIHTNTFYIAKDGTAGLGGWTINTDAIFTGTKDLVDYTTSGITLGADGSLHAKQFFIDSSGNANFKGKIQGGDLASKTFTTAQLPGDGEIGYGIYPDGTMFLGEQARHILVTDDTFSIVGLDVSDIAGGGAGLQDVIQFDAYATQPASAYYPAYQSGHSNGMFLPTGSFTYAQQNAAGKSAYTRIFGTGSNNPSQDLRNAWDAKHLGTSYSTGSSTYNRGTNFNYMTMGQIPSQTFAYRPLIFVRGTQHVYDISEIRYQMSYQLSGGSGIAAVTVDSKFIQGSGPAGSYQSLRITKADINATVYENQINTNKLSYVGQEITLTRTSDSTAKTFSITSAIESNDVVYFTLNLTSDGWFAASGSNVGGSNVLITGTAAFPAITVSNAYVDVGQSFRQGSHNNETRGGQYVGFTVPFTNIIPIGSAVNIRILVQKYDNNSQENDHSKLRHTIDAASQHGLPWDYTGDIENTLTGYYGDDTDVLQDFSMTVVLGRL